MARRREKRGFGSIRRLASGNYQTRYLAQSGERVTAPTTFVARMDAEAWLLAERRVVEDASSWLSPKDRLADAKLREQLEALPTFEDYAERWLEARRSSRGEPLRRTTKDKYRSSLRTNVYPTFGPVPLDKITRAAVRKWHEELDVGPSAKSDAYATLRTILNTAVDEEVIEKNPAQIRGAARQVRRKNLRPASATGTNCHGRHNARAAQAPPAAGHVVRSTFGRVARAAAKRRSHHPRRDRCRDCMGRGLPRRRTRTEGSSRPQRVYQSDREPRRSAEDRRRLPIGIDPRLSHPRSQGSSRSARRPRPGRSDLPRQPRPDRAPVRDHLERAREDLDLHDLRHTGATWAAEEGASIAELMYRLGHSTPSMAIHYQHSRQERDREISRRLSRRNGLRAV